MPSYEEMRKILDKVDEEFKERDRKRAENRLKELEKMGLKPFDSSQHPKQRCDHPNTMEDSTATILWIVVMIISLLFKGGWVLCILETLIWFKFIARYSE